METMISYMEDLDLLEEESVPNPSEIANVLSEEENTRLQTFNLTESENLMQAYNTFVQLVQHVLLN